MNNYRGITLSLVIPCFNEAKNLPRLVARCAELFGNRHDTEVVFVDNGSLDNTQEVLSELVGYHQFASAVKVDVNQGYGFGIVSGLKTTTGEILAWTHADLQTDPADVIEGLQLFEKSSNQKKLFVKGRRIGRPLFDLFFTAGMTFFESLTLRVSMSDINAQPTMFHRTFYETWQTPPHDSLLDLFVYYQAKIQGLSIQRFPVHFGERKYGEGYLPDFKSKIRFSAKTIRYSYQMKKASERKK